MTSTTFPTTMTVWRQREYGSAAGVSPETIPVPQPGRGEVLVRVSAVSLNSGDIHLMRGEPGLIRVFAGARGPRVRGRGMDVAGTVVAAGADVPSAVGDAVAGAARETLADYVVVPAKRLSPIPEGVPADVAACLPVAGNTAVQALDACRVGKGSRVLVLGAGGGVGTLTVQLAAARGAEVWATCGARAQDVLHGLGATRTFDYRTTGLDELPVGSFDAVIEIAGEPPLRVLSSLLRPGGTAALVGGGVDGFWNPIPRILRAGVTRGRFRPVTSVVRTSTTAELLERAASGAITPHIERVFPLAEAGAALAYVEAGHTVGKVVVAAS